MMKRSLVFAVVMALAACSHGKDAKREEKGERSAKSGAKAAGRKTPERDEGKSTQKAPRIDGKAEPMTTSKTTKKMFKPAGLKKLQAALNDRLDDIAKKNEQVAKGNQKDEVIAEKQQFKVPLAKIEEVEETGQLDATTQEALRAFQRSEQLPETGLLDYESLRRLGIKPDEIFHHETPAERGAVNQ